MAHTYSQEELEAFVSKEVASLCDADPAVLAQYIVALIGTQELNDTLKTSLQGQLTEFFDDQTIPFINRLFAKIKGTDSQSNAAPASSSTTPANAARFNEFSDDEDDGDRNFKHRRQRSNSRDEQDRGSSKRRLDQDGQNGSSNKYFRSGGGSDENRRPNNNNPNSIPITGGYNGQGQFDNNRGRGASHRGGRGGRGGSNMNRSGGRPQCRDYNEKGFCMRGDMCPYDHGMDRVVVEGNPGPYPGPFPAGGPMPPMGVRAVPPQNFFGGMAGAVPDAYDPERSGLMPNNDMGGGFPNMPMMNPNDMMMNNGGMMRGNGMRRGNQRGRGGRGGYQGHRHHNSNNPQNTTLNVEKIPAEFCQISTVNDFFAKFGTITNISVQPHAQKAVIQYSTRAEAEAAYNSPDAIFDNRFVKVYWHKDDAPATANAANATDAAAAASAVAAPPKSNEPDPELVAARAAELAKEREEKQKKHKEHLQWILDIQKKRENQLQQQIDEQKRLLAKLTDSATMSAAEKAELLKALKNIQKDIDTSKSAASQPIPAAGQSTSATVLAGAATEEKKPGPETTEELAKKLARLEAEAANLGINASAFRGGRGGYYGRGRGSYSRGAMRGGMAPRMTLDNRPTKVIAKDIPQDATEAELRQHFEQFGNVTLYEQKEGEVLVQYGARFEAEKAMAVGTNYSKGKLALAWATDNKAPAAAPATITTEES